MKKPFKIIIAALIILIALALAGAISFLMSFDIDRGEHYQSKIERLWPESFAVDKRFFEEQKASHPLAALIQYLLRNPLMGEGPYFVAYPVKSESPAPAVLVIPGGGYIIRAEMTEGHDVAQWLNDHCIAAFVLNYRIKPHPAPLSDALRAMQILRSRHVDYNIDPNRLGVMGFSAGGHLAASASTLYDLELPNPNDATSLESARPDFSILAYPVISFIEHEHEGSREALIGVTPTDSLRILLSAERQVDSQTPPAFVWAPKSDSIVSYQNAEVYAHALKKAGVKHELQLYPEGMHGSALAKNETYAYIWPEQVLKWMEGEGFINTQDTSCAAMTFN